MEFLSSKKFLQMFFLQQVVKRTNCWPSFFNTTVRVTAPATEMNNVVENFAIQFDGKGEKKRINETCIETKQ